MIILLDTQKTVLVTADSDIKLDRIADKNIVLVFDFSYFIFADCDKMNIGRLFVSSTFYKSGDPVSRQYESKLSLVSPSHIGLKLDRFG